MKILRTCTLFSAGGCGYVGLEMLWRGYSHYSMFFAGGCCFMLLGKLQKSGKFSLSQRALAGTGVITGVELLTGLIANRDFHVWDYRRMPVNFMGQICLGYTALWGLLTLAVLPAAQFLLLLLEQKSAQPIDKDEKE